MWEYWLAPFRKFMVAPRSKSKNLLNYYSGTPPYDHPVNHDHLFITATLFWLEKKAQSDNFLFTEGGRINRLPP